MMNKKYNKTSTTLFVSRLQQEMKKLRSELNEHRYYLEKNVALRTDHLTRRIELLESCNASLCGKLAQSRKEFAEGEPTANEAGDGLVKLYLLNTDGQRTAAA